MDHNAGTPRDSTAVQVPKEYPKKDRRYRSSQCRKVGLGYINVLPDFLVFRIFRLLDPQSLLTLTYVSRALNLFAGDDIFWKPICLKLHRGDISFKGTWKRTAIFGRSEHKPEPYQRIDIKDFNCNKLLRRWYRSSVPLSNWSSLPIQNIERRSNLSLEEFINEYDSKNKPVIITDALDNWRARTEWTKEKFLKRFGNHPFKTDEIDYRAKTREKLYMGISDYFEYAARNQDEDPIYLFDNKFGERELGADLLNDYEIPIYFKEDFFQYLEEERPPYRWMVVGPARSGSAFHIDPYRTSAWNALLVGRKRWVLTPYNQPPLGMEIDFDDDGNFDCDAPEPMKWFMEHHPHIHDDPKRPHYECILEAGEVIYVPSGWWHTVLNLTDTIAVTQNFCNKQNFETVCAELKFDDDDLWEEFQDKVSDACPDLVWPRKLQKSGFKK